MSRLFDLLKNAVSPLDLDRACGHAALSVHDEAVQLAAAGAKASASPAHLRAWGELSRSAFPSKRPARFYELSGRGGGKSRRMGAAAALAVLRPQHDDGAAAGTRVVSVVVAPRLKQASEVARAVVAVLRGWSTLGIKFVVRGEDTEECEIVITAPKFAASRAVVILPEGDALRSRAFAFVGCTEAGHHRDLAATVKAAARLAQFEGSQLWCEGTPGPPSGHFYDVVEARDLFGRHTVARGASFLLNPKHMPLERCRETVPDARDFAQEILATRWGLRGDTFFDAETTEAAIDSAGAYVRRIPGRATIVALDLGHGDEDEAGNPVRGDASAIVQAAPVNELIRDDAAPILRCVVTSAASFRGTRSAPLRTEDVVARAVAVADGSPIICDRHYAESVSVLLKDAGYTEFKLQKGDKRGFRGFTGRKFHFASMAPEDQESRFTALRTFANGGRLHVPDTKGGRALVGELANITATELLSGTRFEAKHDDLAKALSLTMSVFPYMVPVHLDELPGTLTRTPASIGGSFDFATGRFTPSVPSEWSRTLPNGTTIPGEPPPGSRDFRKAIEIAIATGAFTPAQVRWIEARGFKATPALDVDALFDDGGPRLSVRVNHD